MIFLHHHHHHIWDGTSWRLEGIPTFFKLLLFSSGTVSSWANCLRNNLLPKGCRSFPRWTMKELIPAPHSTCCRRWPWANVCCSGLHYNLSTFGQLHLPHFLWNYRKLLSQVSFAVRMKDRLRRHYERREKILRFYFCEGCMKPELSLHWIQKCSRTVFFLPNSRIPVAAVSYFFWLCHQRIVYVFSTNQ